MNPTIIGVIAGCCSAFGLVPQVVKTHRSRHTKDLSFGMISIAGSGAILWTLYGLITADYVIIITNIFVGIMYAYLAFMKIKHG